MIPEINSNGFFSAGRDSKIFLTDLYGEKQKEFKGHTNAVNSLSQSDPTFFVSGSWDGTAKVWDVATGECTNTLTGHAHAVTVLSLPKGIIITGSQNKKICIW